MMIQMQAFAACDDEEIRKVASVGYGRIVEFVQAASDAWHQTSSHGFSRTTAQHRILAALHMTSGPNRPAWARLLEEGGHTNARH